MQTCDGERGSRHTEVVFENGEDCPACEIAQDADAANQELREVRDNLNEFLNEIEAYLNVRSGKGAKIVAWMEAAAPTLVLPAVSISTANKWLTKLRVFAEELDIDFDAGR